MVDLSASRHMETLVAEFLWTHPDYDFQSVEIKHPCVLAFFGAREWLIDRLGSYEDNLRAMLAAAREWFPPGTNTPAFRVFCFGFELPGNLGADHVVSADRRKLQHLA